MSDKTTEPIDDDVIDESTEPDDVVDESTELAEPDDDVVDESTEPTEPDDVVDESTEPTEPDDEVLSKMHAEYTDMSDQYLMLLNIMSDLLTQIPKVTLTNEQFDYMLQYIKKQIKINGDRMNYIMTKVDIK